MDLHSPVSGPRGVGKAVLIAMNMDLTIIGDEWIEIHTCNNSPERISFETFRRAIYEWAAQIRPPAATSQSEPMNAREVCAYLRCNRRTLARWIAAGKIHPDKPGGRLLFDRSEVERFKKSR